MKRQMLGIGFATVLLALSLSACDSGKSGGSGNNKGGTTNQCSAGQVWIAQYNGCFSTAQCPVPPNPANSGYVPQVGQCIVGIPGGGTVPTGSARMWSGNMNILNWDVYQQLLKDQRICGWPYNDGAYDCVYWQNYAAFQLDISANSIAAAGTQTRATIIAYQSGYYGSIYRFVPFNGQAVAAANNTTIEMQTTGSYAGYNDIFKMIGIPPNNPVPYTDLKAITSMRVELLYKGTVFGYSDVTLRW